MSARAGGNADRVHSWTVQPPKDIGIAFFAPDSGSLDTFQSEQGWFHRWPMGSGTRRDM